MQAGPTRSPTQPLKILQIVPSRRAYGGVADYSSRLAEGLLHQHGIGSVFLSGTPGEAIDAGDANWPTIAVTARTKRAFTAALERTLEAHRCSMVILHMAGYGYQRRGIPIWLARGVQAWRQLKRNPEFLGIFHEIYATGPKTSSAFWLSGLQKAITRHIWANMDYGITTNSTYYAKLLDWRPQMRARAWVMPVMSTIGEPSGVPSIAARPNRLVMFAGQGIARLSRTHRHDLQHLIEAFNIEEIADVGQRAEPALSHLLGVPIICHGRLPDDQIAKILLSSRIGILPYANMQVMGKSTILAAYLAHGVVPIAIDPFNPDADGLRAGCHYLTLAQSQPSEFEELQRNGRNWYLAHSLEQQAKKIADLIQNQRTDAR